MDNFKKIENLVKKSAELLGRSLDKYWPVVNPGMNGVQEANLTLHLASQAIGCGFFVYPEASNANSTRGHSRVDLLILSSDMVILVEAKKLYSSEKAEELVIDFEKAKNFLFVNDGQDISLLEKKPKYILLLAITSEEVNKKWWNNPYSWDSGGKWDKLKSVLDKATFRSSIDLLSKRKQHILYAIFKCE